MYTQVEMKAKKKNLSDEWIHLLWYIYMMEYYLAIKKE